MANTRKPKSDSPSSPSTSASSVPEPAPAQNYTVVARRYRPQQFNDLVGQEPVARALVNAIKSNRVAHAYLFTGARGVGKTSAARILAKALDCVQGPTPTPCDACDICRSIAAGDDVDVVEIDGASTRGIDDVREIRSNVAYRPSRTRYKIYIIDEVHMLSKEAFNALLKTLEEPPAHVKFIFATTEVQKIPITILSRCQRFDFAGIGTPRIVERLRQIVAQEGMQADDEALELLARRASGSMRDAQSLLDQLLAFGGERLTVEQVHQLLGTAPDERVMALAGAVLARDPQQALAVFSTIADEGVQLGELLDQLIAYWRDLMVVHCAGDQAADLSVPPRHREGLTKQAASLKIDTILAGLDILAATKARMRGSNHGRTLFEMAVVRLGRLDDLASLSQLAQWLRNPERAGRSEKPGGEPPTPGPRGPATSPRAVEPPEGVKKKLVEVAESGARPGPQALSEESLPQIWQEVLAQAGPMMGRHLQRAQIPAISGPNTLVLRFTAAYNSEREYCQEPSRLARLEEALRKLTGQAWQLRVEPGNGAVGAAQVTADESSASSSRYRRPRNEALQEPLLKRALDVLGAQLVHVDEGFGAAPAAAPPEGEATDNEEG